MPTLLVTGALTAEPCGKLFGACGICFDARGAVEAAPAGLPPVALVPV